MFSFLTLNIYFSFNVHKTGNRKQKTGTAEKLKALSGTQGCNASSAPLQITGISEVQKLSTSKDGQFSSLKFNADYRWGNTIWWENSMPKKKKKNTLGKEP